MTDRKIGVWLIGGWGNVSTTAIVGLAGLAQGVAAETGLVSSLPAFHGVDFADWNQFVLGGHEIRDTSSVAQAEQLHQQSHVFSSELITAVKPALEEYDRRVRTGTLLQVGSTIESLAGESALKLRGERPAEAVERLKSDLTEFRTAHNLAHVIVVNLSSTEPPLQTDAAKWSWAELSTALDRSTESPLPASSLYATAAMLAECSYVNFTPSIGSDLPALQELALEKGVLHVGRDGKTGETLMKSVLAPMFAARNLSVMSWVGHNIFGNLDGKVLDDPINKANKVRSKDHLLTEILGYQPQTLVSIEYIESMGDWKTAWDHIHFRGFLDTQMTLQFIWQGCDSLLAAPLVLDLIRFTECEQRRGGRGVMSFLSSFFKSPMGTDEPRFQKQYDFLIDWAEDVSAAR